MVQLSALVLFLVPQTLVVSPVTSVFLVLGGRAVVALRLRTEELVAR